MHLLALSWPCGPVCDSLGLQFKVLYRVHFSKSRLSKLYPEVEDKCDKCHGSPCHLSHMFFLWPDLKGLWAGYFTIISTILGLNLQPCPLIAIFVIPDPSLELNSTQKDIIAFTSLLARRFLLLHWKSAKYPLKLYSKFFPQMATFYFQFH